MDVAFIVKGQTFLKTMAPVIIFASRLQAMTVRVFAYIERPNKTYDNVRSKTLDLMAMYCGKNVKMHWVNNDDDLLASMEHFKIRNFVAQDAQNHCSEMCRRFKSFSISQYTDTLHYAKTYPGKSTLLPSMTYFPTIELHEKAEELIGKKWPAVVSGSPLQDHMLWLDASERFVQGSVLFLTPPADFLADRELSELDKLAQHCVSKGAKFYVKDRAKFPMPDRNNMTRVSNDEAGFPYTSLQLLYRSDIHISSYSIAAFEAQFLGRPSINIELSRDHGFGNSMVKSYDLSVYNTENHMTVSTDFVDTYERLVCDQRPMLRDVSFESCVSKDIVSDMIWRLD